MQASSSSSFKTKPSDFTDKEVQDKLREYKRLVAVNKEIRQRVKTRTPQVLTNGEKQQMQDNWKIIDNLAEELENHKGFT